MDQVDGREITRRVLGEMSAAFETPWRRALEFQQRNPDMLAYALRSPDEFGPAAKAMVPFLAMFHPAILQVAVVHCEAVAAEFALDDVIDVRDGWYNPTVTDDETVGGDQLHDRVAWLEDRVRSQANELAELRALAERLGAARGAGGSPPSPPAARPGSPG